jgi:ribonuclease P protein component
MLPKKNRIPGSGRVKEVLSSGKRFSAGLLSVKFRPSPVPDSQFAVVISKKTCKQAVGRNRLRRQIMEVIRLALPAVKTPVRAVIIAKPSAVTAPFKEIESDLNRFFKNLNPNAK